MQSQEEFTGLYKIDDISANTIVATIKECYDGTSTMAGTRNEVATQLREEENRAVFLHCYGHALNLVPSRILSF